MSAEGKERKDTGNIRKLIAGGCAASAFVLGAGLFSAAEGSVSWKAVVMAAAVIVPQLAGSLVLAAKSDAGKCEKEAAEKECAAAAACRAEGEKEEAEAEAACSAVQERYEKACRKIYIQSQLMCPVMGELSASISHNLSSTTEPISAELLHIRESGTNFLKGISSFEGDVKDRVAITRLHNESVVFNRDLETLSRTVQDVFTVLENHIANLKTVSDRIGGIAENISEISEQIRILSFNASIEAARAGNAGAGFRVIAGEIKRLSADTEARLGEIRDTLREAKNIFGNIGTGLQENRGRILDVVAQRQTGFAVFEQTLENYFPKLEELYNGVTAIIESLSKSMDVISPVVQLHEITSQEIGNMALVAADYCMAAGKTAGGILEGGTAGAGKEEAAETAEAVRRRLTTERELEAMARGIRKTVPDAEIKLGINNRDIELF